VRLTELWQRFDELERGPAPGSDELWLNWVLLRNDDGAPVGTLQAPAPGDHAWIGYALFPPARAGYATGPAPGSSPSCRRAGVTGS
jgi:hypothetical protein